MRTVTKNKIDSLTAVLVVAALLSSSMVLAVSESAEAAGTTTSISNFSIYTYDQSADSYSNLAYLDKDGRLPESLAASEWVHGTDGFWYNIDRNSDYCGKVLTYSMIPAMTVDEIRTDILEKYSSVFSGSSFLLLEVSFTVVSECNVEFTVAKDSTSVTEKYAAGMTVNDYTCKVRDNVMVYTVDPHGSFQVDDVSGDYSASIKCDGSQVATASVSYVGDKFSVSGLVCDADGNGISDATVSYAIGSDTVKTLKTDSNGHYYLTVERGEVVHISGVTASGYSFNTVDYSTGNVYADHVVKTINAKEKAVKVQILDQSGRPCTGATVTASWHLEYFDSVTSMYLIADSDTGVSRSATADENGYATILYQVPSGTYETHTITGYGLYVSGIEGTFNYICDNNLTQPSATEHRFDTILAEEGNVYPIYKCSSETSATVLSDAQIKAVQHSFVVSVDSAVDGDGNGGAPLYGVDVKAQWVYQKQLTGGYWYSADVDAAKSEDYFGPGLVGGTAVASGSSDRSGEIVITYTVPSGWTDSSLSTYLVVSYSGGTSIYTFDVPDLSKLTGGTKSFPESDDITLNAGCSAMASDTISDTVIKSDEVAYTVHGVIKAATGTTLPSPIEVFTKVSSYDTVGYKDSNDGVEYDFEYTVLAGKPSTVEIGSIDGYVFTPSTQSIASAMDDSLVFRSVCSVSEVAEISRSVPVLLDTYTVSGLVDGDVVEMSFSVGGTAVTLSKTSSGATLEFPVYGRSGNRVSDVSVICSDAYVPEFSGNAVEVKRLVEKTVVLYADEEDDPQVGNTLSGETINVYVGKILFQVAVSSAGGTAVLNIPEGVDISYMYLSDVTEYHVEATEVSSGPFKGDLGINLHGLADVNTDVPVSFTVQYVSSSSLDNTSSPVKVNIVTEPYSVTYNVGDEVVITAPALQGFKFSGWYIGGQNVSDTANQYNCTLVVKDSYDSQTLTAAYSPLPAEEPEKGIDSTTLMIGLVAIAIAILAFAYVLLQNRNY